MAIAPNRTDIQSHRRHVDSCEFWKNLYESSYKENTELRAKIRVEEERQRLLQRAASPVLGDNYGNNNSMKRRFGLEEVEGWTEDEEGSGSAGLLPDYFLLLSGYGEFCV
jgi:hypothetical protein